MGNLTYIGKVESIIKSKNGIYLYTLQQIGKSELFTFFYTSNSRLVKWHTDCYILLEIMDYVADHNKHNCYITDLEFTTLGILSDTLEITLNGITTVIHKMLDCTHFQIEYDNGSKSAYHIGEFYSTDKPAYNIVRTWLINQNTIKQAMEGKY